MQVDEATVRRIARLARIKITDAEAKGLVNELSGILNWVEQLKGMIVSDDKADGSYAQNGSTIAVFAKDERALDAFRAIEGSGAFTPSKLSPWTDDASDILGPFLSQWRRTS